MVFKISSIVVPIVVYMLMPYILSSGWRDRKYDWLLLLACLLFFVSWYLPSPLIHGQDTHATTHFLGGGVFTGLIWWYCMLVTRWKKPWYVEAVSLFALVCTLGVINELAEVVFVETGIARITLTDTSYDLVANTLGAATVYGVYALTKYMRR